MQVLYHYCSVQTMFAIMQEPLTLRLSNPRKSNDKYDCNLLLELYPPILDELLESKRYDSKVEVSIRNAFDSVVKSYETDDYLTYTFCLSTDGDSLSQWSMYGDNAYGVAIGFNLSLFSDEDKPIRLHEVKYSLQNQKDMIRKRIELSADALQRNYGKSPQTKTDFFFEALIGTVRDTLKDFSIKEKHYSFSQEKEWRLCYTEPFATVECYQQEYAPIDVTLYPKQFSARHDKITSFYDLAFADSYKDLLISEIRTGPRSNLKDYDLKAFLQSYGYSKLADNFDDLIIPSESSYR